MATPKPVVLCGKTEKIATAVIASLKPEFEVIHLILTPEAGCAQIPLLLRGEEAPSDSSLGSKDYSQPPVAILLGAGYEDNNVADMMQAAAGDEMKKVPWLRPDTTKPAPPLGPGYGEALVQRIKDTMGELEAEGKLDSGEVVWY